MQEGRRELTDSCELQGVFPGHQLTIPLCFLLEKRQDNGRVYYVNHNTRTTQWEDPRTQG